MAWIALAAAGLLETVWAIAPAQSQFFSQLMPSAVFGLALTASMALLALALRDLPVGTAYAVWVGIGALGTAVGGMLWLGEGAGVLKMLCLLLIVVGVIGLNLVH